MPPLYLLPALIPAFTGLIWLLRGCARPAAALRLGWSFGFGFFLAGLYWVGISFLVDAARFAWAMPFAVAGLAAGLAIFSALVLWLVALGPFRGDGSRLFALAAVWVFLEGVRSWIFTGFPWNLIGTVWSFAAEPLQLSAYLGVWGLSFVTILAAGAPALLAGGRQEDRRFRPLAVLLLLLPALLWGGGMLRLAGAPSAGSDSVEGVRLRLVQPSIDQKLKWQKNLRGEHVLKQMRMTVQPGFEDITHVIWAETAAPFYLSHEPEIRKSLAQVVPPGGYLLTGAPRALPGDPDAGPWNSLYALDPQGEIAAVFDKFHLVPFGEYVPFRQILSLAKLTAGERDFQAGPGPQTMRLAGLPPFSPLVCYEVIFPGAVTADSPERPEWLVNVTNDAWFGTSSGPYQHLAAARFRAVEEGIPLVRVANNGITAAFDGYGRLLVEIGLNDVGVADTDLPRALSRPPLFARLGNILFWLVVLSGLGFASVLTLVERRPQPIKE